MKKILVIDDNPRNNSIFTDPLDKYYKVDVMMSLVSIERILKYKTYDLLVIDVMMPTQNTKSTSELTTGFFFYQDSIKEKYPHLKVLFWSNRSSEPFEQFFSQSKPENVFFLHKDRSNHEQLLEEVVKLIGK